VGLSGKDGGLIRARKLPAKAGPEGEPVDLGRVGEVEAVDAALIEALLEEGFVPVVAPVGAGAEGESFNINADTVAAEVAVALGAAKLVLLTDVAGVLDAQEDLISSLTNEGVEKMIAAGAISGGMIPKVRGCCEVVARGVGKVHIIDGRLPHALLLEIFTDRGIGTEVIA
jgi:acetylglutamate kinase